MKVRAHDVVYLLPSGWTPPELPPLDDGIRADRLGDELVARYFAGTKLGRRFSRFLRAGFLGVLVHDQERWRAFAWTSVPGRRSGPAHLSRGARRRPWFWIMGCRTHEDFRGQGLYKRAMVRLIEEARSVDPDAPIYIDTGVENVPARRAITRVGFEPTGTSRSVRLPRIGALWWRWSRSTPHPPPPGAS